MASLRLSSVTVNCPDAGALADFYAGVTGGRVTVSGRAWATLLCEGGRVDFQGVDGYVAPRWPDDSTTALLHLDFLVDDLAGEAARVEGAGARRLAHQPNAEHCLVFADPAGHPFCLTTVDELG